MLRHIQVILIAIVAAGCSDNIEIPKDILSQSKMQGVMWDLIRADEFVSTYIWKNDSLINREEESVNLYKQIFQIHNITKDQFRNSLSFYRQHPKLLKIIVDSLNTKGNSQQNKNLVFPPGDTLSLNRNSLPVQ